MTMNAWSVFINHTYYAQLKIAETQCFGKNGDSTSALVVHCVADINLREYGGDVRKTGYDLARYEPQLSSNVPNSQKCGFTDPVGSLPIPYYKSIVLNSSPR